MDEPREGWIAERDAHTERWLCGDREAIACLRMLMQVVEAWDDIIDQDKPHSPERINEAFVCALYGLPALPFYARHAGHLLPLVLACVNAWHDSNALCTDESRRVRNLAFHLRNMGLEFYIALAFLTGGYDHMRAVSPEIRRFFCFESFEDWEYA